MKSLPVVAAIPAYNAELTLGSLLSDVLEQEYDDVYVLDDASTDNTLELAYGHSRDIVVVAGKENLGPGANRNRIIPELGYSAIIHFLDSDVRLNSKRSPEIARELGSPANIGFVGGMVRNPDGTQNPYNYGPRVSLRNDISSAAQYLTWMLGRRVPSTARFARDHAPLRGYLEQWPNPYETPRSREVFWSSEANMVIRSRVFAVTGGYDSRFRFSEIFDYAMRLDEFGMKRLFDPALDVTHHGYDTAGNKIKGRQKAARQLRDKYGMRDYLIGPKERLSQK